MAKCQFLGGVAVIVVSRYSIKYDSQRGVYVVRGVDDIPPCPGCGARLRLFGHRLRHVIDGAGIVRWYELRRLRCDACRSVHLELPAFIAAGKYYDARTIKRVAEGILDDCPAEDSTIRRWKQKKENLQPDLPLDHEEPVIKL